jgi:predicted nucleic acid-binding protein
MIVYLDSSALVKRYIRETGSVEVNALIIGAEAVTTNLISRAEVPAAIMRASRMDIIKSSEAQHAINQFRSEWLSLQRLPVTETTVSRAEALVVNYDLRAYDAVHLAAALLWQEAIGEIMTLATFDRQMWEAAQKLGMNTWPDHL